MINEYRVKHNIEKVTLSKNLERASVNHLDYLIQNGFISHLGLNNSQVSDRAVSSGSTALTFGEVIGYSVTTIELFHSWVKSDIHNSVLLDKNWKWVGYAIEEYNNTNVSVVNFSDGNLDSISILKNNGVVILSGQYLEEPIFKGNFDILNLSFVEKSFVLRVKPLKENLFIYNVNKEGEITDRFDFFLINY
ncbi:MAG: CAP domain-containing protein [Spirochaetaceae bacterium]